eukprot:4511095-Karenia_brevis.AAC.1
MEHPAPRAHKPSSFHTPEIQKLLSYPQAELQEVDQCVFGARSRKPTALCCVCVPSFGRFRALSRSMLRCDHGHQHLCLRGCEVDNFYQKLVFQTAAAKEYPMRMNRFLSSVLLYEI